MKDKEKNYVDKTKMIQIIKRTLQMDLTWDWSCGVAYYGICRVFEVTHDEKILELVQNRIDEMIALGLSNTWTINKCAMGHCLLTLYEAAGNKKYWQLIESKIRYLQKQAPRFANGVLQHTVSDNDDFPEQAWADTLFMSAFFMLRVGVRINNQELINDALNQYYWHIIFLQDENNGLFYHGYENKSKTNLSGIHWGRANAWAAYTLAEVNSILPKPYLYPKFMDIQGSLDEQLSAIKQYQTENGLWRTVIDDPHSYEEVSASCGIAAAMLIHGNPLHRRYVMKTLVNVQNAITTNGKVMNVSAGTAVMPDRTSYEQISKKWIQGWGQGLMLAFLAEFFQFENTQIEKL